MKYKMNYLRTFIDIWCWLWNEITPSRRSSWMQKPTNERTVFDFKTNNIPGLPDGMTIDSEGILYVANFNGGQVLRVDPNLGKVVSSIKLPASQITSVVFGGANLDELYVTSANIDPDTHQQNKEGKGSSGCLFKVTGLGVKGLPMTNVKL